MNDDELETARDIASGWLAASTSQIARAIEDKLIQEVADDNGEEKEA